MDKFDKQNKGKLEQGDIAKLLYSFVVLNIKSKSKKFQTKI